MFRTFNAVSPSLNFYEDGSEVEAPPSAWMLRFLVVTAAPPMAERTIILMPFICSGVYLKMINAVLIIIEICIFYDGMVDIKQFFYIVY